ncbi:hypothetical protein D3C86_2085920 [compost metagenome]
MTALKTEDLQGVRPIRTLVSPELMFRDQVLGIRTAPLVKTLLTQGNTVFVCIQEAM